MHVKVVFEKLRTKKNTREDLEQRETESATRRKRGKRIFTTKEGVEDQNLQYQVEKKWVGRKISLDSKRRKSKKRREERKKHCGEKGNQTLQNCQDVGTLTTYNPTKRRSRRARHGKISAGLNNYSEEMGHTVALVHVGMWGGGSNQEGLAPVVSASFTGSSSPRAKSILIVGKKGNQ